MPKFAMLSMVAVAALMGAAVATPHPECEPCAAAAPEDLLALANNLKYLCCDLTCVDNPSDGCGVFNLDPVCKACHDGDGIPSYDAPPVTEDDGVPETIPEEDTTEAPAMSPTSAPVAPVAPVAAPVAPVAAPVAPVAAPVAPVATPVAPVAPVAQPVAPVAPVAQPVAPVAQPVAPVAQPVAPVSPPVDEEQDGACTACDEAEQVLTTEDFLEMEREGLELVCDPECFVDTELDGCGAFGLEIECRVVDIPEPSGECIACDGADDILTAEDFAEMERAGLELVCDPECFVDAELEGCGAFSLDFECRIVDIPEDPETGEGEGEGEGGGGGSGSGSGSGSGGDGGGSGSGSGSGSGGSDPCTTEEEAICADISAAQSEALAAWDGGGKIIVCDPTCDDGVSDPTHCNYFGLAQRCRGCGECTECTPCP